jgi:hypothetical protein
MTSAEMGGKDWLEKEVANSRSERGQVEWEVGDVAQLEALVDFGGGVIGVGS